LLNTHIDTVPPFYPAIVDRKEGVIRGRGACDTKSILAAQLLAAQRLVKAGKAHDLGLLYVVSEETDHSGMKRANSLGLRPQYLIVGEPTESKMIRSQKGILKLKLLSQGVSCHSGYPELGKSAIDPLIDALHDLKHAHWPQSEELGTTTLNIGLLRGGHAANALAAEAEATLMFRVISPPPRRTPDEGRLFDATLSEDVVLVGTQPGTYTLGPVTRANYSVKIIPVAGRAVVGPAERTANASSGNVTDVDFTVAEPPAPTTIVITAPSTAIVDEAVAVTGRITVSASATVEALTGSVAVSGLGSGCTTATFTPVTGQTNLFSFSCVVTPRTPGSFRVTAAFSNSTTPLPPFGSSATSSLVQVLTEPPVPLIPNERVGGADRVGTAVAISKKFFAGGADIVYIATDFDFADALVAGPPAGLDSAPVLLTAPNELPASVAAEIRRLRPTEIVIVGGTRAVSSRVQSQLTPLASVVTRIGGVDRYATAALLSRERISGTGGTTYIATGLRYPDAVSAGVPAASIGAPILLVAGDTVPSVTTQELERRRTSSAVVVGGTAAVGAEAFQQLRAVVTNVERISGADRYATSAAVARRGPQTPGAVFLVTGENFPDALAAVPAAIVGGNAMLLTRKTCLPTTISTELRRLQPGLVYVIGGSAAITNAVRTYTVCS
jgi:putative cell wall-binding protein